MTRQQVWAPENRPESPAYFPVEPGKNGTGKTELFNRNSGTRPCSSMDLLKSLLYIYVKGILFDFNSAIGSSAIRSCRSTGP